MKSSKVHWVRLGDLVEPHKHKCGDESALVSGVDINKQFISTRANLEGVDVSSYYSVPPKHFACNLMHIGRDIRIPIAYNDSEDTYVVTSAYYIFRVKESRKNDVLEEYIYIYFNSTEKDRLAWFYTDGSVRGNLPEQRFLDMQIPLFDTIEEQRSIVGAWKSLRNLKGQNESIAKHLMNLCQSYIESCRNKYKPVPFGTYVQRRDERNQNEECTNVKGLTVYKEFIETKADMTDVSLKNYKRVYPGDIAYVSTTNRNGDRIACGLASEECIVSSIYDVFYSKDENILDTSYLFMWFKRPEMDRYARYNSWGSARETITWEDLTAYRIPIPPIDVQRAVVSLYQCALEYKAIAAEADAQARSICSALMQHAINC